MSDLLPLPILIPLFSGVLSLFLWRRHAAQRAIGVIGSSTLTVVGFLIFDSVRQDRILVLQIGNWPAPFGITLVADLLSAVLVLMTGFIVWIAFLVSLSEIGSRRIAFGFCPLLHFLTMGICGAFLTGDIFNLYVWFEVMLIASFVLLGLGGERLQLNATIQYVTLNLMASALFLAGVGVLYGVVGTLNMADLAQQLRGPSLPPLTPTLAALFMLAFGVKAAVFPLFFWLPASYPAPPPVVSAVFAGLLTKVGVYSLLRFFTLIFPPDILSSQRLILILSALTMLVGILGALPQRNLRRIFSFNLISHIGYLLAGLGLFTPLALAGSLFYLVHDIIAKTCLFLFSSVIERTTGQSDTWSMGRIYRSHPKISWLFFFLALAVSGIPPFSGFWGKLMLIQAALSEKEYGVAAVMLLTGLLTLYSLMKVWAEVFWKDPPTEISESSKSFQTSSALPLLLVLSVAGLTGLTLLMGLLPGPFHDLARETAQQLFNADAYIETVLGDRK
jgi:multicomponent Na+:H+ antiporter subunit D